MPGRKKGLGRFRFGIQDRIVLWLLVLGMGPVIVTSVLGHWVLTRAAVDSAGRHLQAVSGQVAAEVDLVLSDMVRGLNRLGSESRPISVLVASANRSHPAQAEALLASRQRDPAGMAEALTRNPAAFELRRFREQDPLLYDRMLVTDSAGVVAAATEPPGELLCADQGWWQAAYNRGQGAVYISPLQRVDSRYLLNIALPLFDSSRTSVRGVLRLLADVSDLVELVEDVEVGETGYATLTSTLGDILVSPFPLAPARARVTTTDRLMRLNTSYPVWYEGRGLMDRSNAVIALAPVPSTRSRSPTNLGGTGWTVSVEQSKAEVLIAVHHFGRTSVFVLLFTAAVVMVVGLFLSDRIVKPLRQLRDGAARIGGGQLELRLGVRTRDEIGDLAREFNAMTERLRESYRGLEDKIRAATAELAQEKNSLQAILTSLGEGLMVVDTERRIILWNSAAEQMTGFRLEEVFGRPCREVLRTGSEQDPDLCASECPVWAAYSTGRTVDRRDMKTYIQTRKGTRLPVNFTASPLFDERSKTRGCVVVIRDISREKEIDRLKSDMISTVSHELRTPLGPIIGFAEMLQSEQVPPDKHEKFLNIIVEEGRRLSSLVDNFLTLSRIEAGKFELNLQPTDVRRITDDVITIESRRHPGHELVNAVPAGFPRVVADSDRIKRVIHNLVSNAIKYSPDGGRVTVSAREQQADIEVLVQDQGIGIREEDIPRLFRRFQRVNREATPDVSGTGLGLSICKSIIREHDGSIRVESEYGKGSTFTFRLPKRGPAPAAAE